MLPREKGSLFLQEAHLNGIETILIIPNQRASVTQSQYNFLSKKIKIYLNFQIKLYQNFLGLKKTRTQIINEHSINYLLILRQSVAGGRRGINGRRRGADVGSGSRSRRLLEVKRRRKIGRGGRGVGVLAGRRSGGRRGRGHVRH